MPRGAHMKALWADPEFRAKRTKIAIDNLKAAHARERSPKSPVTCDTCGTVFMVNEYRLLHSRPRFCSRTCHAEHQKTLVGEKAARWKDGTTQNVDGYIVQRVDGKPIFQHRWIMEQHLGRSLETFEHVHHVNGDKADNRIENLELLTKSEHHSLHFAERERDEWNRFLPKS